MSTSNKKVAWVVIVVSVLLMVWLRKNGKGRNDELTQWLESNGLPEFEEPLKNAGISNLQSLIEINSQQLKKLRSFKFLNVEKLMQKVDHGVLVEWLKKNSLLNIEDILRLREIHSMSDLKSMSKDDTNAVIQLIEDQHDRNAFEKTLETLQRTERVAEVESTEVESLPSVRYAGIVVLLYLVVAGIFIVTIYVFCGKILGFLALLLIKIVGYVLISVAIAILKTFFQRLIGQTLAYPTPNFSALFTRGSAAVNPNQRTQNRSRNILTSEFKLGLYDRITGRNLDVSKSQVTWNHSSDTVEVGGSSVAMVKFLCRNGTDYKLQASDNLSVRVVHSVSNNVMPHVVEPSSIVGSNMVKISFTTRLSGEYIIDIQLNGIKVSKGGVIKKHYKPGPVDSEKTVFLQQSNTIVVTAGLYYSMEIIPKDCFGNIANIHQKYLTAEIRKGGPSGEIINPECVVDRGGGVNRYEILLKVELPGHYVGCVMYEGLPIGPSSINIISLSETDSAQVDKNVAKKCNVYFEAQYCAYQGNSKPKKVYCYPSPKQLQIREYYLLGIIPKRLYTCKVCPQTRIIFHEKEESFTIDDGYQSPILLMSPHREVLAATFYKFLLKNIGGSEKFQDKQNFFYAEVKKLKNYRLRTELSFTVDRDNVLEDFMSHTKHLNSSDWYKKFYITFKGEEGLDWGGVSRELFQLLCVRCFDPAHKLFKRFSDNPQSLVHPNPKRPSNLKLKHYEFAGRIVGKCLYESAVATNQSLMVKARFSRSFLAQIIGLRINHKYFESDIPDLYTTKIQYIRDNDVSDLGLVFAEEEFETDNGLPIIVPLIEKGEDIEVTNSNKSQYLNLLAQYKLAKCVKEEVESFLKGLNDIIPENLLSIFDENELELLMCGMETVSFNDLKIHAVISGSSESFKEVVDWFWNVVSNFTQEEMAKLIQFVTGCSQLPPGGFKDLHPPFQIISSPTHGRLPTAHTCFNQICLPSYDSFEQFQQSLTLAINEGSEGFGFA